MAAPRPRVGAAAPEAARPTPAATACSVDVWTVDDPDEMRVLAAAGVDAIITNVPDVALADRSGRRA